MRLYKEEDATYSWGARICVQEIDYGKNNRKGDNKSLVGHNSLARKADISSSTHVNIG